jgi:hypothetical protein
MHVISEQSFWMPNFYILRIDLSVLWFWLRMYCPVMLNICLTKAWKTASLLWQHFFSINDIVVSLHFLSFCFCFLLLPSQIINEHIAWNAESKLGSLDNMDHRPGGGNVHVRNVCPSASTQTCLSVRLCRYSPSLILVVILLRVLMFCRFGVCVWSTNGVILFFRAIHVCTINGNKIYCVKM